jgi:hypothetical protein
MHTVEVGRPRKQSDIGLVIAPFVAFMILAIIGWVAYAVHDTNLAADRTVMRSDAMRMHMAAASAAYDGLPERAIRRDAKAMLIHGERLVIVREHPGSAMRKLQEGQIMLHFPVGDALSLISAVRLNDGSLQCRGGLLAADVDCASLR